MCTHSRSHVKPNKNRRGTPRSLTSSVKYARGSEREDCWFWVWEEGWKIDAGREVKCKTVALEVSVRVAGFGQWCLKDASQCKASRLVESMDFRGVRVTESTRRQWNVFIILYLMQNPEFIVFLYGLRFLVARPRCSLRL